LEPTEGDPCRGAVGTLAVLARFLDGKLALFDAVTGELGAQATYKFLDDHTISVDDKEDNLCDAGRCPVTWKFEMTGDRLTFDLLARDPWIVGTWEAVPFQRVS
jgi:hypothetical protein